MFPKGDDLLKKRLKFSEIFLKEAAPQLIGPPRVWARQVGEEVTFKDTFKSLAKARVPFAQSKLRTDALVFHELPTRLGLLYAVQFYSGPTLLPLDYLIILPGRLPRSAFVKEGFMSSKWETSLTALKQPDAFKDYLDNVQRGEGWKADKLLDEAQKFTHNIGASKIEIKSPYSLQLIALPGDRYLFLYKRNYRPGFWKVEDMSFDLDKVLNLIAWVDEAIKAYNYQGPAGELEIPVPAMSLAALPMFAEMMGNPGVEIPWPAPVIPAPVPPPPAQSAPPPSPMTQPMMPAEPPPPAQVVPPAASPEPQPAPSPLQPAVETPATGSTKFCIACGQKIPGIAVFCPVCGSRQS